MPIIVTDGTHRNVINAIHTNWYVNGEAFALRDVASAAPDVSMSSIVRALAILKRIKLVSYSKRAYLGRHYRVAKAWPLTAPQAIQAFEYAKILRMQ